MRASIFSRCFPFRAGSIAGSLPLVLLLWGALATPVFAAPVINEILAHNVMGLADEDGECSDWIEIVNQGDAPYPLTGCSLSDDPAIPVQWIFPAQWMAPGERLVVFASGKDRTDGELHANFKIAEEGEVILFVDSQGQMLDLVNPALVRADVSLGRAPMVDGTAGDWGYLFADPTPGLPNEGELCTGYAAMPVIDTPGGLVDGPFYLSVSDSSGTADLVTWTLGGAIPDPDDAPLSGPILIDGNRVLRARAFEAGKIPSDVATASYLFDDSPTLPVISIVADPDHLFDEEIGIYVLGPDYDPVIPHYGANFWEPWERPASVEYFDPAGGGFALDVGLRIHGNWSRALAQKSLRLHCSEGFGTGQIEYPIFGDYPVDSFERLILRNAGVDFLRGQMRDALGQSPATGPEQDTQAYRPARVYINGEYWGLHNIRERQDKYYVASHYGVSPSSVDLAEKQGYISETMAGDATDFRALKSYVETHDLSDPAHYAVVEGWMDVENFIHYNVVETYFGNYDWPANNRKFWRSRELDGRWRWMLYDLDITLGHTDGVHYDNLAVALSETQTTLFNPPWSTAMLRGLMASQDFREAFINTYAGLVNGALSPDSMLVRFEAMKAGISGEVARHFTRWGSASYLWTTHCDVMEEFLQLRPGYARQHVVDQFDLAGTWTLGLDVSPGLAGTITLPGVTVTGEWEGTQFLGIPLPLQARPAEGYRFLGWSLPELQDDSQIVLNPGDDMALVALFTQITADEANVVINEINYHSEDLFDPGDWVEFHNPGLEEIDLSGWIFRDGDDAHGYYFGHGTVLPPGGYLVLCQDLDAFASLFPEVAGPIGPTGFGFSAGGESLRLFRPDGTLFDRVDYDDAPPWPVAPDGNGPTLALISPLWDNNDPEAWAESTGHGSPGESNDIPLAAEEEGAIPAALGLAPAWPNPFNPATRLRCDMPRAGLARLTIHDARGREVARLVDGTLDAGRHEILWRADGLPSGVYLARLHVEGRTRTGKLLLLK